MSSRSKKTIKKPSQIDLFEKINDICNTVTHLVDAKELLELSLKKTMRLFDAQRGSIFIVKENSKELILKIAKGMKMSDKRPTAKQIKRDLSRAAERKISAPLMLKDKMIGVIHIADKSTGKPFSHVELQLLDFLASQIALNYHRIRLYKKFKNVVKESKALKDELGRSSKVTDHLKKKIVVQEKLASIGKLAGGIAHEFNNPLDGVIRYTHLCLERTQEDDVVRNYLLEIKQGLNRMANIVRSLLACSRSSLPAKSERVDITHAIEQAVFSLQSDMFQKNIQLTKNFTADPVVMVDLGVERIITNLLRNAIDAVDTGGRITVGTKTRKDELVIMVSDSGTGIPKEVAHEIFEPFFTTKDIDRGCGLGLTIVNEIVKSYNGVIDLKSTPQKGTTFTITIPRDSNHD